MSTPVTYNGTTYNIPVTGETNWGTEVTNFLVDVGQTAVNTTGSQTLTNKTLTSPTINGGTITAPTLIVNDNVFSIRDNLDTTKVLQLQLSGLTTATTRTLTVPDADDTIVVLAASQTLTNKTLTSPTIRLLAGTDAIKVPVGTTAQRPGSPNAGDVRYNSDDSKLEYYNGSWTQPGAGTVTSITAGTALSGGTITTSGTIALDINGLTGMTDGAAASDYLVMYDTSGAVTRKVLPNHLATTGYSNQQYFAEATLTDQATIAWDVSTSQVAKVTLGGNRTMGAPTNLKAGGTYVLRVIQDGTGSRTITWNAVFKWPAATAPTLTTTASAVDIFTFVSDGTNLYMIGKALNVS